MIRLLATYLRPYRRALAVVLVLVVVQALANLYLPTSTRTIINNAWSRATPATSCGPAA